jgi:flagellar L-ring protein precursor FlgH
MRALLLASAAIVLAGCTSSLNEIGVAPYMSPVGTGIEPQVIAAREYPSAPPKRFSLWSDKQSRLFTDPRALSIGDILTVAISINDKAQFKNQSDRKRDASRSLGLGGSFSTGGGAGGSLDVEGKVSSGTASTGSGATTRSESINLLIAAVVTDVLPNGNLMIVGSQEVRVNAELRILTIAGLVRPSDIGAENIISYDRIAEARISYGGRGRLTEVQQPPYGQQILDAVLPF